MIPKAQHYVPQFYLRNFSGENHSVWCFDKTTQKSFKTNIKNIAHETGFYNYSLENGETTTFEPHFWRLETNSQKAIQELCDEPTVFTVIKNIEILALFCAIQELRTPVFRDNFLLMNNKYHELLQDNDYRSPDIKENQSKEFQAKFINESSQGLSQILKSMKWILVKNKSNNPFWTSDNPIFRYNPLKDPLKSTLGLQCSGIQLFLPVCPSLMLLICDPIGYRYEKLEIDTVQENIDFYNNAQVISSRRYLFSNINSFQFARDLIREHKNLANPKNPRILVD